MDTGEHIASMTDVFLMFKKIISKAAGVVTINI